MVDFRELFCYNDTYKKQKAEKYKPLKIGIFRNGISYDYKLFYKAAGNASKISKTAKVGGKALCAIAIVSDANDIYNSFKSDNNTIGKNTITTSSRVIAVAGGAKAGAALGEEAAKAIMN